MRRRLLTFALVLLGGCAALQGVALAADPRIEAANPARRLVIGIDLSKSNPLVSDAGFAAKLAQRVKENVLNLGFASEIHVRTFGSYGGATNSFYFDAVISRNKRPERVAADVAKLIAGTPLLVEKGVFKTQDKTNIIAFLDNAVHSFGCAKLATDVILATDGIEDSEYARLSRKDAHLPAPDGKPFAGCASLSILGLGRGQKSPEKTVFLRKEWETWARAAGFKSFIGLNDW